MERTAGEVDRTDSRVHHNTISVFGRYDVGCGDKEKDGGMKNDTINRIPINFINFGIFMFICFGNKVFVFLM